MASEDASTTETPDSGQSAGPETLEPVAGNSNCDNDPLSAFADRLHPGRRFYANPAGS